ncbi:RPS6KA5 [Symbiodinium necroappetens]|uniref:non-specific serine/threonine protein kinase n=1 Tax=Symbiodinium necroappetens TaxID=1628268 RepID=A0A812NQI3_9DINO|nr:RPS6KA5 [Symbiodinium necroappetens]
MAESGSEDGSDAQSSGGEDPGCLAAFAVSPTPFEKISCLGEGAFGAVWLARCKETGRNIALKEVPRHLAEPHLLHPERDVLRQVARSREDGSSWVSPALTELVMSFTTSFAICLAMELVEGAHLLDHVRAASRMSELQVQWYTAELAAALTWLHTAGWLYRDLKLTNVMVSLSQESYGRVKLIDYGFAFYGAWCDKAVGTLRTMAPEVICCADSSWLEHLKLVCPTAVVGYGPAADWWSLGILLYELLTGQPPYGHQDDIVLEGFQTLQAQLASPGMQWPGDSEASGAAKEAVSAFCRIDPADRPSSGAEVRRYEFFASIDWAAVDSSTAPGPSFDTTLGHTAASAAADPCRPRRGALPVACEEPDPFTDW